LIFAETLGVLFGTLRTASAFGSYLLRRLFASINPSTVQDIHVGGIVATAGLMFVLRLPLVLAAPVLLGIISGFVDPNMRLYVNKHVTNQVRTSVLSFSTTTVSFGTGIGFVSAYYLADRVSASVILVLVTTGTAGTIVLRLFYSTKFSKKVRQYTPDKA
jgi:MFS family permease